MSAKRCLAVLWALTFCAPLAALAEDIDRLQEFDARITVRADGALDVVETILVQTRLDTVRTGIERHLPARVIVGAKDCVAVPVAVHSVERDGQAEPWRLTATRGGAILRIGNPEADLDEGLHRYEIRYRADGQLGARRDVDELVWRVAGDTWSYDRESENYRELLPIDRASASVALPRPLQAGAAELEVFDGSDPADAEAVRIDGEGQARFRSRQWLARGQAMTVALRFAKGQARAGAALPRGVACRSDLPGETVRSFDQQVEVQPDGSLQVSETFVSPAVQRSLPVRTRSRFDQARASYEILSLQRDGEEASWEVAGTGDTLTLALGGDDDWRKDLHTWVLRYRADWLMRHSDDHDALDWTVTGGWSLPLESATARVTLPGQPDAAALALTARSGPPGKGDAAGGDWQARVGSDGALHAETTRILLPGDEFAILARLPKGLVSEPGGARRALHWMHDNPEWSYGLAGLLLLFLFYFVSWHRHGRDPRGGTVIPRFSPPEGITPADACHVWHYGYGSRVFVTALAGLARKGWLNIRQIENARYVLERLPQDGPEPASEEEGELLDNLQLAPGGSLAVSPTNFERFSAAARGLAKRLDQRHRKVHFATHRRFFYIAVVASFALALAVAILLDDVGFRLLGSMFMLPATLGGSVLMVVFGRKTWREIKAGRLPLGRMIYIAVYGTILAVTAIGVTAALLYHEDRLTILILLLSALNITFFFLLPAPTPAGRKLLDELAGFRMYLETAERDELQVKTEGGKAVKLREKYLPYALALEVEKDWSGYLSDELFDAGISPYQNDPHDRRW